MVLCDPLSYEFLPIVTAFTIFLNLVYFSLESSWTSGRLEFGIFSIAIFICLKVYPVNSKFDFFRP